MRDLTKASIAHHILALAAPVALSMIAQMAYQLVDLYFVTKIGVAAVAGVNAAGNAMVAVMALMQVLGVSTVALLAHAAGRKDQVDADLVFNQAMMLSAVCGLIIVITLHLLTYPYLQSIAVDAATVEAGAAFLSCLLPGYAITLPMAVLGSALRGIGVVRPTVVVTMLTVMINIILAPILISGWGTDWALGVKGAGLATSTSIAVGAIAMVMYFRRARLCIGLDWALMRPRLEQCRRIATVGLPAGCESALIFVYTAVVYYTIRNLGASAQAGFGIGLRVLQAVLLPALAIGSAAGPIVGQNLGARNSQRVKEAFWKTAGIGSVATIAAAILVQWRPGLLLVIFDTEASAIAVATSFLQIMSWVFVAQTVAYTCSSMFQGLGNTFPSLISSGTQITTFCIPAVWLSMQPSFRIEQVWHLTAASVVLQAVVSLALVRIEFKRRVLPTGWQVQ